ncbi:hypothetical protein M5D96_013988, partial [Drosophila gunungcola]
GRRQVFVVTRISRAPHAFRLSLAASASWRLDTHSHTNCTWLGHLVELLAVHGRAPPALLCQLLRQLLLPLLLLGLLVPALVLLPRTTLNALAIAPQQLVHVVL